MTYLSEEIMVTIRDILESSAATARKKLSSLGMAPDQVRVLSDKIVGQAEATAISRVAPIITAEVEKGILEASRKFRASQYDASMGKNPPKSPPRKGTGGYDGPTGFDTRMEKMKKMGFK